MAKHSINLGHCIQLQDTSILSTKSRWSGYREWPTTSHEQGGWPLHRGGFRLCKALGKRGLARPLLYKFV
jgi:hypothetical protein